MRDKRLIVKFPSFLVTFLLLLSSFTVVKATNEDIDYTILNYNSNVTLDADGSAYFDERITYRLEAETVILDKPLPMLDVSGIEDLEVLLVIDEGEDAEITVALSPDDGKNNDNKMSYTYEAIDKAKNLYNILIKANNKDGDKATYLYRYRLKDIVFIYKDTAAFFWQFVVHNNMIEHDYLKANIHFPKGNIEQVEGYIGGSVYNEKGIDDSGSYIIVASKLKQNDSLESALLMPTDMFPDGRKLIDNSVKSDIVEEMTLWEQEVFENQRQANIKRILTIVFITLLVIAISLIGLAVILKYKRGSKHSEHIEVESHIQGKNV